MKSASMLNYFNELEEQRNKLFPKLNELSMEQLWRSPREGKWTIGETIYHLYLMIRLVRVAAQIFIPLTSLYAHLVKNKRYNKDIVDIYSEYQKEKKRQMKAPSILNPPRKIVHSLNFEQLNQLLANETEKLLEIVNNIDEEIAGHIHFFDPIARNPNLIQSIKLLVIHEYHHFKIIEKDRVLL